MTKEYDKLHSDFKNGKLTENEASNLNVAYKEKPDTPEKVTSENIDSSLDFLFDDDVQDNILRERTRNEKLLNDTIQEKEELSIKVKEFEDKEFQNLKLLDYKTLKRLKVIMQKKNGDSIGNASFQNLDIICLLH